MNEARIENAFVLVEGNQIKTVSTEAIDAPDATAIDGDGGTLTPGFIENHAHLILMEASIPAMEADKTWVDFGVQAVAIAEMYLMQGFTTVRDMGGIGGGLRSAIDSGVIPGPRHCTSGAFLGGRARRPCRLRQPLVPSRCLDKREPSEHCF